MATNLKLPDPKTFTRNELAKRWKCDISLINRYIETGQLKEGFNVYGAGYEYLRQLKYFVCKDDDHVEELKEILDTKTWSEIESSKLSEKFIDNPMFLYLSFMDAREIEARKPDKPSFFNLVRRKLFLEDDDMVDFFCDLEWNPLVPIIVVEDKCLMISVREPKSEDMIIPLEEVLRFESENPIGETNQNVPATVRQEKMPKKEREDFESTAPETNDNIPGNNKPPPARKPPLTKKEVAERIGISVSHVENLRKQEDFPKSFSITGGRLIGWDEDEIDQWIEERKNQRGEPINETKKTNE